MKPAEASSRARSRLKSVKVVSRNIGERAVFFPELRMRSAVAGVKFDHRYLEVEARNQGFRAGHVSKRYAGRHTRHPAARSAAPKTAVRSGQAAARSQM